MCVRLLSWNVEGLAQKISEPGFKEYVSNHDICCLTETFTCTNFDFSKCFAEFSVSHAPGIKLSSQGRRSGGVALLVKKTLAAHSTTLDSDCDTMVAIRICNPLLGDTIIICAYIPPIESPYYKDREISTNMIALEDLIVKFQESFPQSTIVVCGDLNARIGRWTMHADDDSLEDECEATTCPCTGYSSPRNSQDSVTNTFGKMLRNLCIAFHGLILNGCAIGDRQGKYTYLSPNGDSVIDYCLVITEGLTYSLDLFVRDRVESQHMPLEIVFGSPKVHKTSENTVRTYEKLCWDASKTEELEKKVQTPDFVNRISEATGLIDVSVDEALVQFTETMTVSAECLKRVVKTCKKGKPQTRAQWYDEECRENKKTAYDALKCYRKDKGVEARKQYMLCRRAYKNCIREKKRNYFAELRNTLKNSAKDSKVFWAVVRSISRRSSSSPHSNIDINTWKEHFQSILETEDTSSEETVTGRQVHNEILDAVISRDEVRSAITKIKPTKAPGMDGLPGGCFKIAGERIIPFLSKLFNKMFDMHYFPDLWSRSIILPLHKKGSVLDPDNYRGISLLSAISKIFSTVLTRRLRMWMELENKVCAEQAGFRTYHSTVDHIFSLHCMILKYVYGDRRGKLYVAFVDYRKAFDSVNHTKLWEVLKGAHLSTKFTLMLKAMYDNVQACVRWGHDLSDFFKCTAGVKQGAIESPSIFSLYINKVADYVRRQGKHGVQMMPGMMEIFLLLFADDIALISTTPVGLQNQIDSLALVSKSLHLKVNVAKTKVMVFRKGGRLSKREKWFLDGQLLEVVNQYKYLGFVFTTKLSIEITLDDLAVRGKRKGIQVLRVLWSLYNMQTRVFTNLLDAQVQSSLLYASEIWGLYDSTKVERTHTFICKKYLGLGYRTPNHMVYGDLGRFPVSINSGIRAIRYWLKLNRMENNRLPKQAYEMLLRSHIAGNRNWASMIRNCLFRLGFGFVWMNGGVSEENRFVQHLKQRMRDCFIQEWYATNRDNIRYVWYSSFKQNFGMEEYLNVIDVKKFRDVFIRFRFGINNLRSNMRYTNIPDRNCPFCNERENEIHMLLLCPAYEEIRKKYLKGFKVKQGIQNGCRILMEGKKEKLTRSVAMYLYYAFKTREDMLI